MVVKIEIGTEQETEQRSSSDESETYRGHQKGRTNLDRCQKANPEKQV